MEQNLFEEFQAKKNEAKVFGSKNQRLWLD